MNFPFHCSESCLFVIVSILFGKLKEKLVYCFKALTVCFNIEAVLTVLNTKACYRFVKDEKLVILPLCFYVTAKAVFLVKLRKMPEIFLCYLCIGEVYFFKIVVIVINDKTFCVKQVRVVFNPCPKPIFSR